MTPFRSRIHYKNIFLHIGHLGTILYNNKFAYENDGICYAIVDDRQRKTNATILKARLEYLQTKNIEVVEVSKYHDLLVIYTQELIKAGKAFVYPKYNSSETLNNPTRTFQIRLNWNNNPTIGYTKRNHDDGSFETVFIFDYIIKVLDEIKQVTNVVTTSSGSVQDITDYDILDFFNQTRKIEYNTIPSYRIYGFRYSKKDWPSINGDDPRLLTIQGLMSRHVPYQVLNNFYHKASERGSININELDSMLKTYLNFHSERVSGILEPLKVSITNMNDNHTEFISRTVHPLDTNHSFVPLSNELYIDRQDFALVEDKNKLSVHTSIKLKNADYFYCTDVELDGSGYPKHVKGLYDIGRSDKKKTGIEWISRVNDGKMIPAIFYHYNWFFTGNNELVKPNIYSGYIDDVVFDNLDKIYMVGGNKGGYFRYDEKLSQENGVSSWVAISSSSRY